MSPIALALEVTLVLLLMACLFYCWRLDRKLSALRAGQDGIRDAARELLESVSAAESAVKTMRQTAHETGRDLQGRIDTARSLADKLGLALGKVRSVADLGRAR